MNVTEAENTKVNTKKIEDLESIISKAIKKVKGDKENDLCKYIPMNHGGYIHHFTLKKMKYKDPEQLSSWIEKFILKAERPFVVPPKQRAPRGSRKKKDNVIFSKLQLEKLINIARLAGDKEMIALLSPKKSFTHVKKDLIQSIRNGILDHELWNAYVESIHAQQNLIAAGAESLLNSN